MRPPVPADRIGTNIDVVARLLGSARQVPVNTDLVALFGLSSAYLLQQFWYWSERIDDSRDGWFYKGRDEITAELSLSRKEQETARRRLVEAGVLEEERRGLPARLWYRLDFDRLNDILSEYALAHPRRGGSSPVLSGQPAGKDVANKLAQKSPTARPESRQQAGDKGTSSTVRLSPSLRAEDDSGDDPHKKTATQPAAVTAAAARPTTQKVVDSAAAAEIPNGKTENEPSRSLDELAEHLAEAGMNRADARRLARSMPDECERQLAFLPFVTTFRTSRGAYLRAAVEQGFAPPEAWREAERKRVADEERQRRRREHRAAQQASAVAGAAQGAPAPAKAARDALWTRLQREDPQAWAAIEARALGRLALPIRSRPDGPAYRPALEAEIEKAISEKYGREWGPIT